MITPSAGRETAGACHGKKSARGFVERRWKSNGGWMARTGCASGAAISACAAARNRRRARQVLPAYGLQSLPPIHFQELTKVLLRTIPGGHFNMAENRTFLLCVDTPFSCRFLARPFESFPYFFTAMACNSKCPPRRSDP